MTPEEAIERAGEIEAETRYRHQLAHQMRQAGFDAGRRATVTGDYQSGFDLGHDTSYSARQDSRAFVVGVVEGFAAGTQARQELTHKLLQRPARDAGPQPEKEAEAG